MDGIILAGGKGTRMLPLTLSTPKPMLILQERPILEWSLLSIRESVNRVLVVVNFMKDEIESYMKSQTIFDDFVIVEQTPIPMGTAHALQCCEPYIDGDSFLVINGDDLYHPASVKSLSGCRNGIMVVEKDDASKWSAVLTDDNGKLLRLHEKPPQGLYPAPVKVNIGAYKFSRDVFDYEIALSPRGEYEIIDYLSYLAEKYEVELVPTDYWIPIATPSDLEQAQTMNLDAHRHVAAAFS